MFNTEEVAAVEILEGFLVEVCFYAMITVLNNIGMDEVENLKMLEKDDIDTLAAKLKKVQVKKFAMKVCKFIGKD